MACVAVNLGILPLTSLEVVPFSEGVVDMITGKLLQLSVPPLCFSNVSQLPPRWRCTCDY